MINSGMFGLKQEDHLRFTRVRSLVNWEEFVRCQVRAIETYSEAKHQSSARIRDVLIVMGNFGKPLNFPFVWAHKGPRNFGVVPRGFTC